MQSPLTGEELRFLRELSGLRLEDISEKMQLSKQAISMLELGKTKNKSALLLYNMVILNILEKQPIAYKNLVESLATIEILKEKINYSLKKGES